MNDILAGIARHLEAGLQASDPAERDYHLRHAMQYLEGPETAGGSTV